MAAVRVLVIGGGDVGSAVAHHLFQAGAQVLISEREGSAHGRRGMAFIDALFDGDAQLAGVRGRCCADLAEVQACWARGESVPIVTLTEESILRAMRFDAVVEATMRRRQSPPDLRMLAPLAIGLGPGYSPGSNCHVAIETQWGEAMGRVLCDAPAAPRSGGPYALDGVTRERFALAPLAGTWKSPARLGQRVAAGDAMGEVAGQVVRAPLSGTLRGLAHDGVEVVAGQRVVEVDPRALPQVEGLGERPLAIARGVVSAMDGVIRAAQPGAQR